MKAPTACAELGGAAEGVALPERQPAGDAGRRGDQHPVVGDVLDPPAGGAEREDVADPGLVDHLLVELADPLAGALAPTRKTPNRPRSGMVPPLVTASRWAPGPAGEGAGHPVPDDARAQLGELVARVAAAEQVEHRRRRPTRGSWAKRRRALHQVEEVVDRPGVERGGGDDLLGEHVERVGRAPAATRSAPIRIRWTATAVWARSPRCLGNSTPRLTSPTWWPARPTRWSALATLGGDSIWTTRSTAPMSMPSSRLLVATTAGSRPRLRSSSISARCSLDTEPWWALAITVSAPGWRPDWAMISAGLGVPLGALARARARSRSR